MGIEGGFEAAHEDEVGSRRSPDVDGALESGWAPRKRNCGVFGCTQGKNARYSFQEVVERRGLVRIREESKVEDAASACEDGMREKDLVSECEELLKKRGEAGGESRDFENSGGGRGFEKEWNRLTEVMPEVGALGFVESNELRVFCLGR